MPSSGQPLEYLGAKIAVFCGAMFIASGATRTVARGLPKLKRWRNPPSLLIVPHSGTNNAAIEVTHSGEPTTWEFRLRIVERLDGLPSPDYLTRLCWLRKDGKIFKSLLLREKKQT